MGLRHCVFLAQQQETNKRRTVMRMFVETLTPNPFLLMEAKDFLEKSTGRPFDIVRNHRNLNPRLRKRIERDGITVF